MKPSAFRLTRQVGSGTSLRGVRAHHGHVFVAPGPQPGPKARRSGAKAPAPEVRESNVKARPTDRWPGKP